MDQSRRDFLQEMTSKRRWLRLAGGFLGGLDALPDALTPPAAASADEAGRALGNNQASCLDTLFGRRPAEAVANGQPRPAAETTDGADRRHPTPAGTRQ